MQLTIRKFYLIGVFIMIIATIGSLINLSIQWVYMNIGGKISFIFGSVFLQILFIGLFWFLYKTTPDMNMMVTPELDDVIKEMEKEVIKNGVRKKKAKNR